MIEKVHTSPRGNVHYWVTENFDPAHQTLVFLHGLTADHTMFNKQLPYFEASYNIVVWDAPAHGKSRPYLDFTYPNAAADLKSILDECNVGSAVMIGQSMGGYVIQSFLLHYPEMVAAFVGIDTCPYGERYYSRSDKWWLRQIEWMSMLYPLGFLKRSVAKQCAATEYGYKNMLTALSPYGKRELCHLMGIGFAGFLEDNRDMETGCPLLILCGEHDRTGRVKSYCKSWATITGAPLVWIKNAAHNANADNPGQVNAEIAAFLRSLK